MNSFYYRHFRKTDLQQIDNIFEKSIRSVKLTLIECNNIFYKWSYRYINIIFGANILFQFINYIYLFYLYFIIVLLFYISSNMYIEYYIFNTYPSMKFDTYYYKENNTMYVALDKNNVIGFVSLKCCNNNIGWMTYLFVDPIKFPIFLKTIGKSFGPITNIATTTIISISNHPICGMINYLF